MSINNVEQLFLHDLKTVYYFETRLQEQLVAMTEQAGNDELAELFTRHQAETLEHVERVEQVFADMGKVPEIHEAASIQGLFKEAGHLEQDITEPEMLDLSLINTALKMERTEITLYEGLIRMSERLDLDQETVQHLENNLEDEEQTLDRLKTMTGQNWLNQLIDRFIP